MAELTTSRPVRGALEADGEHVHLHLRAVRRSRTTHDDAADDEQCALGAGAEARERA